MVAPDIKINSNVPESPSKPMPGSVVLLLWFLVITIDTDVAGNDDQNKFGGINHIMHIYV